MSIAAVKADLGHVENTIGSDNDKPTLLGWSGQKSGTDSVPQETTPFIMLQSVLTL
jgi:hypothetical protein